jgi:hypothetical protein
MYAIMWRWSGCPELEHSMQFASWDACVEFSEWLVGRGCAVSFEFYMGGVYE